MRFSTNKNTSGQKNVSEQEDVGKCCGDMVIY